MAARQGYYNHLCVWMASGFQAGVRGREPTGQGGARDWRLEAGDQRRPGAGLAVENPPKTLNFSLAAAENVWYKYDVPETRGRKPETRENSLQEAKNGD